MEFYIKFIDAFSQKLNLHFQGREYFPTFLGGLMTIGIIVLSIVLTLDLGGELYLKKKPNLSFNKIVLSEAPKINLENNGMIFALTILDKNYQVFNYENYFEIEAYLYRKDLSNNQNFSNSNLTNGFQTSEEKHILKMINCIEKKNKFTDTKNNKFNFVRDFEMYDLNSAKCLSDNYYLSNNSSNATLISLNQSLPLQIYGDIKTNRYSNIRFFLKRCNKLKNNSCKEIFEIDKILKNSHFAVYFIDKGIDPFLFTSPYSFFINTYFAKLDLNLSKKADIYFKNSTIKTDIGLMLQDFKEETDFTFDYFREQTSSASDDILFELSLNSSRDSEFLKRFYMKIQDLAAMIGGIINVSMVAGELISRFFNRHIMYTVILNKLFNFKIKTDDMDIIKTNINMNDILDKNSSDNSELSKEIVIKGNKRLNRRRSAIFLNTNAIQENIMQNEEIIKKVKKEKLKGKKTNDSRKKKSKDLNEKDKELYIEKNLEKMRKELDLITADEIKKITDGKLSKNLNLSDFMKYQNDVNVMTENTIVSENKSYDSKEKKSNKSSEKNQNKSKELKRQYTLNEKKVHSSKGLLKLTDIEMKKILKENPNPSKSFNNTNEESIPLERVNSDALSLKLFVDYNRPKHTLSTSQKDYEIEYLSTEKRNLITETAEKINFDEENVKSGEKINLRNSIFSNFPVTSQVNLNYSNLNKIDDYKKDETYLIKNYEKEEKNKQDNKINEIRSSFFLKRRNNIYNMKSLGNTTSYKTFKSKASNLSSKKIEGEIVDLDELKKNKGDDSVEMAANLAFFKNLQLIEEKKDEHSQSVLMNYNRQGETGNATNQFMLNDLEHNNNNDGKSNLDSNISNRNIKKFIKNKNLEFSKSFMSNKTVTESGSDDEQENNDSDVENNFDKNKKNEKKLKIIKGQLFDKFERKKKSSINKLAPGALQIICMSFCPCTKKSKKEIIFMDESQKLMGNYLDYLRIIKFLKEFNRLKKILFSNSQLKLFSYLPKPNVTFKNNELKIDSLYGDIFSNDKEMKKKNNNNHIQYSKLFDSYVKLLGKQSECDTDKKINKRMVAYMDKEMKNCFEDVVSNYLEQVTH